MYSISWAWLTWCYAYCNTVKCCWPPLFPLMFHACIYTSQNKNLTNYRDATTKRLRKLQWSRKLMRWCTWTGTILLKRLHQPMKASWNCNRKTQSFGPVLLTFSTLQIEAARFQVHSNKNLTQQIHWSYKKERERYYSSYRALCTKFCVHVEIVVAGTV